MTPIHDALVRYITALAESADRTRQAEDRAKYRDHLAVAARMVAASHTDATGESLKLLIEDERRSYGWSFLSGDEGNEAEAAFNALVSVVEGTVR